MKTKVRYLRKNMPDAEKRIWRQLRNKNLMGLKFRRQFPIGSYIVDFCCYEMKIVIELDGGQHGEQRNIQYDIERTKYIESCGYRVFRYWNNEVNENMEGILEELMDIVRNADSVKNLTLTLSQGRGDQPLE